MLDVLIRSYNTVDTVLYPLNAGRRDAARRSRKTWGRLIYFFFPRIYMLDGREHLVVLWFLLLTLRFFFNLLHLRGKNSMMSV